MGTNAVSGIRGENDFSGFEACAERLSLQSLLSVSIPSVDVTLLVQNCGPL